MSRLGDDDRTILGDDPWPGPARALIDIFGHGQTSSFELVQSLGEVVEAHQLNILSLGPPLRLQLPVEALADVMDAISYERVRILHWPFSSSAPPSR